MSAFMPLTLSFYLTARDICLYALSKDVLMIFNYVSVPASFFTIQVPIKTIIAGFEIFECAFNKLLRWKLWKSC